MQKLVLIVAALAFFLGSCTKDGLTYYERRAIGEWEFIKMSRNGVKVTNELEDNHIRFKEDFSATYANEKTGDYYTGVWDMVVNYSGSDDSCDRSIFASFTHNVTGEIKQVVLSDLRIGKKRIVAYYREDFRNYRYVLEK